MPNGLHIFTQWHLHFQHSIIMINAGMQIYIYEYTVIFIGLIMHIIMSSKIGLFLYYTLSTAKKKKREIIFYTSLTCCLGNTGDC